jgi:predicted RNase H-like HicB family nuclease
MSSDKVFELVSNVDGHDGKFYAARVRPLGLTAYGYTPNDALESLKKMFEYWLDKMSVGSSALPINLQQATLKIEKLQEVCKSMLLFLERFSGLTEVEDLKKKIIEATK